MFIKWSDVTTNFESLDEDYPVFSDDLFETWNTNIPSMPIEDEIIPDHDRTVDKTWKDITLDSTFWSFKELDFILTENISEFEKTDKVMSEIKLESVNSDPQPTVSSSSFNSSESSGSNWQLETSKRPKQDVDTKFTLETPPISPQEYTSPPQSPQSSQNVPNALQRYKLIPINKQDIKHTQYILAKTDSAQNRRDDNSQNAIILHAQDINSDHVLYSSDMQSSTTNTHLPQSVKIINAMPIYSARNTEPLINTSTILKNEPMSQNDIAENEPMACMPFIVKKNKTNCAPIIIKNEVTDFGNLPGSKQECELKALKRQQRMIKNRESACLSRKKKKEYVSSLERQILELKEKNKQLTLENTSLKQRLMTTKSNNTSDNSIYGNVSVNVNKKNVAILLGMVFMISFNFNGLGGIFLQNKKIGTISTNVPVAVSQIRHSRTLLWTVDTDTNDIEDQITESFNTSIPIRQPVCPMYINQSESIRLDSELRRWIDGESDQDNWTTPTKTKIEAESVNSLLATSKSSLEIKIKNKLHLRNRKIKTMHKMIDIPSANNNAVEIFSPILSEHASLFEALGRKDDTFYVVWFSGEHLLLPASRKNNTARPKMSLVLPAVSINGTFSAPPNHITMMQIDCEVTNTQLLHLKQSVIPIHLRNGKSSNQSSRSHSVKDVASPSTVNITRNYKPYFVKETNHKTLYRKIFKDIYNHKNVRPFHNKDTVYATYKEKYVSSPELKNMKNSNYSSI